MNNKAIVTSLVLIIAAIGILSYKLFILNIPLLPYKSEDSWRYEILVNKSASSLIESQIPDFIYLPIPPNLKRQSVETLSIKNEDSGKIISRDGGQLFQIAKEDLINIKKFKLEARIQVKPHALPPEPEKLSKEQKSKFLDLNWLSPDELQAIKDLNDSIIYETDSKKEIFNKIAYFLLDEFILQNLKVSFKEVIEMKSGDPLSQAKVFLALARLNKIPSRVSFGTSVVNTDDEKNVKHMRLFINEYYLDGKWSFYYPSFPNIGHLPESFILVHRDITPELEIFNSRDIYTTKVKPIRKAFFDSHEYYSSIVGDLSRYSNFSLYKLPLGSQNIFYTLLLIPIGTLVLSFARNIVGLVTFGVFTPILLTLFFIETSFVIGIAFLSLVFITGITLHYLLNKLYLLAVPKLSIILTVVIILYMGLALFLTDFNFEGESKSTLNYFPIIIVTILTERFMILLREEGLNNTLKTFLGTVIVSIVCFFIFSIKTLNILIFNHPELLLLTIAMNILIGSYTGFRLSEFFRFKELINSK